MKFAPKFLTSLIAAGLLSITAGNAAAIEPADDSAITAARGVLLRTTGGPLHDLRMEIIPGDSGRDSYTYEAKAGVLNLRGSGTIALCRAFYDYARAQHLGQISWAEGTHLKIPVKWPDAPLTKLTTPFEIRHAHNIVTSGYTTPYWTWERWERELDWQAMHGFNMLMAPVATEAIMERVWLKAGLTQAEIDQNSCGPAHMPWFRMGNICGIGGFLSKQWHAGQIALQRKILGRMRELGMEPVVQGFNGFVPHAYTRIEPGVKLHNTQWNDALPPVNRPRMVDLASPQFAQLTKDYMSEWHREFGPARYVLVDSFNEMEVPKTDRPMTELLAEYGEKTWQAIHAADPAAIWTIQGWTFGYQNWKPEDLAALFSKVPDERMFVLDYANDYFPVWKKYQAFHGKTWACGYVPNMGGKTAYTGNLNLYASGHSTTLKDPSHGKLKGFTLSGEGLENNEVLYELLTDAAWSAEPINLDEWLVNYSTNRYGACPPAVTESWRLLREGCYSHLIDHPRFAWQCGGKVMTDPGFLTSAAKFLSVSDPLGGSALYRADAVERAALVLGMKADEWYQLTKQAHAAGDSAVFDQASARTLELLTQVDALMEAHPYHRMKRWIDFARAHGDTPELKQTYETNARCIVTYWADGVQNYSARVWGGLVRDYYREWLRREFDALQNGTPFDANRFMIEYTKGTGTSSYAPCANPVADAKTWLQQAMEEPLPAVSKPDYGEQDVIGQWSPGQITTEWKTLEWNIPASALPKLHAIVFTFTGGNHRLEIQEVAVVADGKVVASDRHFGYAGRPDSRNVYPMKIPAGTRANNSCLIRAIVKGGGGIDSNGSVGILSNKP
jgi:alpha-N-acetylglucosaminidase